MGDKVTALLDADTLAAAPAGGGGNSRRVTVLCPLPDEDFDITEVSVPWRLLRDRGHRVVFATEHGTPPAGDPLLLTGVLCGQLGADPEPREFYLQLREDAAFREPLSWEAVNVEDYDGLLLPGGHAPGMRQYLGSLELGRLVARFWALKRPVGAICHGVLVLARARDESSGLSLLAHRNCTCLPYWMEWSAYMLTCLCRGRYYRTYEAYVETEVKINMANPRQFRRGPLRLDRGTATNDNPAFCVVDDNLVTARWPGDAYKFARLFIDKLESAAGRG